MNTIFFLSLSGRKVFLFGSISLAFFIFVDQPRGQETGPTGESTDQLPEVIVEDQSPVLSPPPTPTPVAQPVSAAAVQAVPTQSVVVIDDEEPDQSVSLTVPTIENAWEEMKLIPGGVAIVDSEDYLRGRATNLKDALDFAPGVFIQPRFGAEESRLSIRGSGIQRTFHGRGIKLLQDGVPLNLADGGFDFQAIEPLATQYIEVYRGGNALEYGATTLGGAINFVSHTGHTAAPLSTRFEYGSFDSLRWQVSSGMVSDIIDVYASLTHSSTDGFRDHSAQENFRFFGNMGIQLAPGVETRTWVTFVDTDSELPGSLTKADMLADPTQASRVPEALRGFQPVARFDNITSDWKRDFQLFRLANRTTWEGDNGKLTLGSFWSYKELDHPILFVIDQESNDFGLNLRYDTDVEIWGRPNHFTVGVSPTIGFTTDQRFTNVFGDRGVRIGHSEQEAFNLDIYAQNSHYFIPDVALVTGGQFSHAYRDNEDLFPVSATDPDNSDRQDWTAFSGKFGVVWDVAPSAQVFANVSQSFEPPSFGELVNAANNGVGLVKLDAQTATTLELGTRGINDRVAWDLAWYHSWVDDELLSLQVAPGLNQTVNAGDTTHHGVEAAFNIELMSGVFGCLDDRINLRTNSLWNDFRFDDDPTFGDNRLPGIPSQYHRIELLYEHPTGFYVGPNLEWVPDGYNVDNTATEFSDPYTLLGLKGGVRREDGLSFFVEAKNLSDEVYAATTGVVNTYNGDAIYMPGDGRAVYAGFEWKW